MSTILQLIGGKTFETGAGSVSKTNADARLKILRRHPRGSTAQGGGQCRLETLHQVVDRNDAVGDPESIRKL